MTIWFATNNPGKKKELSAIFQSENIDCDLLIPADIGIDFDPEETETSFYGNALLKARALYSLLTEKNPLQYKIGDPVIADDSGLCVDALNGRPGIYSARYAGQSGVTGKKLQAHERNALLLEELGNNPVRSARFICAMTLFFNYDLFFLAQETCEGEIVKSPEFMKGTGGFGYDPIFYLPECGKTAAELSDGDKNRISHRGKAGKTIAQLFKHRKNLSGNFI